MIKPDLLARISLNGGPGGGIGDWGRHFRLNQAGSKWINKGTATGNEQLGTEQMKRSELMNRQSKGETRVLDSSEMVPQIDGSWFRGRGVSLAGTGVDLGGEQKRDLAQQDEDRSGQDAANEQGFKTSLNDQASTRVGFVGFETIE